MSGPENLIVYGIRIVIDWVSESLNYRRATNSRPDGGMVEHLCRFVRWTVVDFFIGSAYAGPAMWASGVGQREGAV